MRRPLSFEIKITILLASISLVLVALNLYQAWLARVTLSVGQAQIDANL